MGRALLSAALAGGLQTGNHLAANAMALAAKQRQQLAVAAVHADVVHTSAAAGGLFAGAGDQRVAFVLCEVEERTSTEVGAMLGEKAATIRARVKLAKTKLREALAKDGGAS